MSIDMVQVRLDNYRCTDALQEAQALREITQEIVLAALSRRNFFKYAVLQGGTCLRIFYGLNRFSEDLDFSLIAPDAEFNIEPFVRGVADEIEAFGYRAEIIDRDRRRQTVRKVFLKDDSIGKILTLRHLRKDRSQKAIRIKLEVDTKPPANGTSELKYLDFPFVAEVVAYDESSLFAGKLHALLCREYEKGRDWYDFLWYVSRKTRINLQLLQAALLQQGPWKEQDIEVDVEWVCARLDERIDSTDWTALREDVRRFVHPIEYSSLNLWSKQLFHSRTALLR